MVVAPQEIQVEVPDENLVADGDEVEHEGMMRISRVGVCGEEWIPGAAVKVVWIQMKSDSIFTLKCYQKSETVFLFVCFKETSFPL